MGDRDERHPAFQVRVWHAEAVREVSLLGGHAWNDTVLTSCRACLYILASSYSIVPMLISCLLLPLPTTPPPYPPPTRQLNRAVGLDNLLYSADASFSCFADLALVSPQDYYKEGEGSLMQ